MMFYQVSRVVSLLVVFSVALTPLSMSAQAPTGTFQPRTQEELLVYLYGVLAQLQAQLAAQQNNRSISEPVSTSRVRVQPNPYSIYAVSQAPYIIGRSSATFLGYVDRGSSPTAEAWFEYGTGSTYTKRTDTIAITKSGRQTVKVAESDLSPGTRYNYRIVIEDQNGNRQYGQPLSFTTINKADTQSFVGRPVIETEGATYVSSRGAELAGFVSMNDYANGLVYIVYGTDRSDLLDLDEYDKYEDIPVVRGVTSKFIINKDFSGRDRQVKKVTSLKSATRYYYVACVEYKSPSLRRACGEVESFTTLN